MFYMVNPWEAKNLFFTIFSKNWHFWCKFENLHIFFLETLSYMFRNVLCQCNQKKEKKWPNKHVKTTKNLIFHIFSLKIDIFGANLEICIFFFFHIDIWLFLYNFANFHPILIKFRGDFCIVCEIHVLHGKPMGSSGTGVQCCVYRPGLKGLSLHKNQFFYPPVIIAVLLSFVQLMIDKNK